MEYTARRFFISFYNSAPLFTLLNNTNKKLLHTQEFMFLDILSKYKEN